MNQEIHLPGCGMRAERQLVCLNDWTSVSNVERGTSPSSGVVLYLQPPSALAPCGWGTGWTQD